MSRFALAPLTLALAVGLPLTSGCSGDDGGGDTGLPSEGSDSTADTESGDTGDTGAPMMGAPAVFRFTCMDIQQMGNADGESIQAQQLETTWGTDISLFRLSILADLLTLDEEGGMGTMQVRSGIGSDNASLCSEGQSESSVIDVAYDPTMNLYEASSAEGTCSQEAANASGETFGSLTLTTTVDDTIYIYAQDGPDGNPFNCTPDAGTPDAVPIRAVSAVFTVSPDQQTAWGELEGCLVESEAEDLCACLGTCIPQDPKHEVCGQCPNSDSIPLRDLLLGVEAEEGSRCDMLFDEPAFDVKLGFVAERLGAIPETCG